MQATLMRFLRLHGKLFHLHGASDVYNQSATRLCICGSQMYVWVTHSYMMTLEILCPEEENCALGPFVRTLIPTWRWSPETIPLAGVPLLTSCWWSESFATLLLILWEMYRMYFRRFTYLSSNSFRSTLTSLPTQLSVILTYIIQFLLPK